MFVSPTLFPQTTNILHTHALRTQPSDLSSSPICPPPTISDTRPIILHHNGNHCPLTTCRLVIEPPREALPPSNYSIIRFFQSRHHTLPHAHDSPGIRVTHCTCKRQHKLGHGSTIIYDNQQWTCEELFESDDNSLSLCIRFQVTNARRDDRMIWLVRIADYTVTWKAIRRFGFKAIRRRFLLWVNVPEDWGSDCIRDINHMQIFRRNITFLYIPSTINVTTHRCHTRFWYLHSFSSFFVFTYRYDIQFQSYP